MATTHAKPTNRELLQSILQAVYALQDDVRILKEDIRILKQDVAGLKQDVHVLKQDVAGLKQDVAILKHDVSSLKQDVNELRQTDNDILSTVNEFATVTEVRFQAIEKEIAGMKSVMVTKPYLDDKLADLRADLRIDILNVDAKLLKLVEIQKNRKFISPEEAKAVYSAKPFAKMLPSAR